MALAYVTLYELRSELGLGTDATGDDNLLRRLLARGTDWINGQCGSRHFDPLRKVRHEDAEYGWSPVLLRDDLLELVGLTNGDNSAIDITTLVYEPPDDFPKWSVSLPWNAPTAWLPNSVTGDYRQALALDGVWGWHHRYANAWPSSLDVVLDSPLLVGATDITVTSAVGPAEDSDDPRFQVGNLIRLGSGATFEYCLVRVIGGPAPQTGHYTLTVQRGANGTTAAQWPANTPIYVFRPAVKGALIRLASWGYHLKDVDFFERVTVLGSTQKVAPGGIPDDVYAMLPPAPLVIR